MPTSRHPGRTEAGAMAPAPLPAFRPSCPPGLDVDELELATLS